jgi:hypothetical protein
MARYLHRLLSTAWQCRQACSARLTLLRLQSSDRWRRRCLELAPARLDEPLVRRNQSHVRIDKYPAVSGGDLKIEMQVRSSPWTGAKEIRHFAYDLARMEKSAAKQPICVKVSRRHVQVAKARAHSRSIDHENRAAPTIQRSPPGSSLFFRQRDISNRRGEAAIDDYLLAGHVGGRVRGEKDSGAGKIARLSPASQRDALGDAGDKHWIA